MYHLHVVRVLVVMLVCILSAPGVRAQRVETPVENAVVVYAEGNNVVLKFTNGEVRLFEIPDSSRFTIDGHAVTVHELKAGMKLTATITTANAPRVVDAVNIIELGTVWKISGQNLIITKPDGENKMYRVPSGGKITFEGKDVALDQLQEGDKITATVVTTRAPLEGDKITGTAVTTRMPLEAGKTTPPVLQVPATPARVGALLIDEGGKPVESPGIWGTPALIILIVAMLVVAVVMLLLFRRKRKA